MRNWDEEYQSEDYVFGVEPNDFLVHCLPSVRRGKALCLGEGEGRNAVFLARHGFEVTAVDLSPNGLNKTQKLARKNGVQLSTFQADVLDYSIEPAAWDLVICFFMHLPSQDRALLHSRVVTGLRPGGAYILEGFSPGQIGRGGPGPRDLRVVLDLNEIRAELGELELRIADYLDRLMDESKPDLGWISVTQVMGVKPESG